MPSCTSWKKSLSPVTIATSKPAADRLRRQRPDHVVGLVALRGEDRHAHRFARLVHPRDLLGEIARHRRAVGLVVGDDVVAERRPGADRTTRRCTAADDRRSACAASSRSRRRRWWTFRRGRSARESRDTRDTSASCRRSGTDAAAWTWMGGKRKIREKKQYIIAEWSQWLTRAVRARRARSNGWSSRSSSRRRRWSGVAPAWCATSSAGSTSTKRT